MLPERHSCELSVELRDDDTDGLGSSGGGGDDVDRSGTTCTPVLAALGGTIDGELVRGHRVNGRHQTLHDAVLVVDHLREGSKAVCRARSVRDDLYTPDQPKQNKTKRNRMISET